MGKQTNKKAWKEGCVTEIDDKLVPKFQILHTHIKQADNKSRMFSKCAFPKNLLRFTCLSILVNNLIVFKCVQGFKPTFPDKATNYSFPVMLQSQGFKNRLMLTLIQ